MDGGDSSGILPPRVSAADYTLPGVMHFLQQEWRRFEADRNAWSVERVQLTVSDPRRNAAVRARDL